LGQQGTSFARGEEPSAGVPVEYGQGGNHALLTNVAVGPSTLPWILYFRGVSYDPRTAIDPAITGTFTTENLLSRRVVVDLAGGALYAEKLPADNQASMFLSEWFQMPIDVQGDKMMLREMPGTSFYPQLKPIYDSEILEIMGQSSTQLIASAKDPTPEHATYLKLLFERVWHGYRVKLKKPNGDVVEANLRP
jgi:hypothetical protein